MSRYPHMMTRCGEGKWPDLVICVDCVTTKARHATLVDTETEVLQEWYSKELTTLRNEYVVLPDIAGDTVDDWWDNLDIISERYHNVLILSYQCGRIWPLLGFWDKLESGHVTVCEQGRERKFRDSRSVRTMRETLCNPLAGVSSGFVSKLLNRDMGLLVAEDSTHIALFRIGQSKCRFQWIDTANHGCHVDSGIWEGSNKASAIAEWFIAYGKILRRYQLGAIRATAGSQAMHGFRHSYLKGSVYVHCHKQGTELESESYHGGRCECFQIGHIRESAYHVDVRSMYPAICSTTYLPARLRHYYDRFSQLEYERQPADVGTIARVTIKTDEPAYPRIVEECTVWPTGSFLSTLAGPELRDAYNSGRIVAWHEACTYDLEPVLQEYANAIYEARIEAEETGNEAVADSIKKLLVCLPGKFAQRLRSWVNCPSVTPAIWWGQWWGTDANDKPCRYRSLGGTVQQDRHMGWGGETVPALASWITSAGRMKLLEAIRISGWDEVYYCDTDALIVTETGYKRMIHSGIVAKGKLGYWQTKEIITEGAIHGIKHYSANGRMVCAGLPKGQCIDAGDGLHYWYNMSAGRACENGLRPSASRVLRSYLRDSEYRHGKVSDDGRVTPIHLEEK